MKKSEIFGTLGLPKDAKSEDVDARYKELKAFLSSERVPSNLSDWAHQQNARLDEAYLGWGKIATEPEEEAEIELDEKEPHTKVRTARTGTDSHRSLLANNFFLAGVGALIGLVILGVALWQTGIIGEKGNSIGGTGTTDQFDPAQYLASQEATLKQLAATVAANPNDTGALFQLGETYFTGERWQAAIDWFTKLVAIDPKNTHVLTDIGTANFNMGNFDAAKTYWQKVLDINPDDAQAHYNMAFLYAFGPSKDISAAKAEWAAVVKVAPGTDLAQTAQIHIDNLPDQ